MIAAIKWVPPIPHQPLALPMQPHQLMRLNSWR
jgi:hypothetical protein